MVRQDTSWQATAFCGKQIGGKSWCHDSRTVSRQFYSIFSSIAHTPSLIFNHDDATRARARHTRPRLQDLRWFQRAAVGDQLRCRYVPEVQITSFTHEGTQCDRKSQECSPGCCGVKMLCSMLRIHRRA